MFRRLVVMFCCLVGLCGAIVTVTSSVASLTVLDQQATVAASRAAIRDRAVQAQLVNDISTGVLKNMPAAGRTEAATTAIRRSARAAITDPQFREIWDEAVAAQYAAVFEGEREIVVLDPAAVTRLVRSQLAATNPQIVALLPVGAQVTVRISPNALPDLATPTTWTRRMPFIAGGVMVVFFGLAVLISRRRVRTLRRIGWWLLGTGLVLTFAATAAPKWGVPFAIRFRKLAPSINRTLIEHLSYAWWRSYVPPVTLAVVGLVLAIIGIVAARRAPENRITRSLDEVPVAIEGQAPVDAWDCKV